MRNLLKTNDDVVPLILRVLLAVVMFPHGAQKVLGWFGGTSLPNSMHFLTATMGVPTVFAALAIAAEFLGSVGLFVGLLTRLAAFGICVEMAVAAFKFHSVNGFFMNWSGQQRGEGIEYHVLVIAITFALMITGGGALSLDGLIAGTNARTFRSRTARV